MSNTDKTLQYYNSSADVFAKDTNAVEFSSMQNEFLSLVKPGGTILDLGCGAGRDSKAFLQQGYNVVSVDGSEALVKVASEYIGREVICATFQDYTPSQMFDGIWACASLLHLSEEEMPEIISKMSKALVTGGCFYLSFKYGDLRGWRGERYFTDMTETSFTSMLKQIPDLIIEKQFITSDVRPGRENEKWLNVFLKKA